MAREGSAGFNEPQTVVVCVDERGDGSSSRSTGGYAPEKKLTLFALRLAVLEKAASGLGTLGFIWATVVLLGGFAITIDKVDFWMVTTILLIEGARIFSRSHELEWQHEATWSLASAGRISFRAFTSSFRALTLNKSSSGSNQLPSLILTTKVDPETERRRGSQAAGSINCACRPAGENAGDSTPVRTWRSSEVPLLPYAGWVFLSRNVSKLLYWLQLMSATACVVLSLMRLAKQDYGEISKGDSDKRNRKSALNIFYSLALAEALLFLLEKAYWEWKVSFLKLLDEVNRECGFGDGGIESVRRFFYDAYSRCVNGSIFDGLKMDLVSFAEELLLSSSRNEQLMGARILRKFTTDDRFDDETLRKIGTSAAGMERLLEMLNWKNPAERELRLSAAEIVSKLAGKKQNALRVAGIPGSMESISSLLYIDTPRPDSVPSSQENNSLDDGGEASELSLFGLLILKRIAHDHDNCGKIGNTRGLLPKIIDFTSSSGGGGGGEQPPLNAMKESQNTKAMKRSLQVVKMLASTTGSTGKVLRQEISEIVFTISNIREILQNGDGHPTLQKLAIEILTSLAVDEDARGRIGRTGGVIRELFAIFFQGGSPVTEAQNSLRVEAGEALAMLALENQDNCDQMLQLREVERLVAALNGGGGESADLRINSTRILHNLCAYSGPHSLRRLRRAAAAAPVVLRAAMREEKKLLEVSLGLATQVLGLLSAEEVAEALKEAGIEEEDLAELAVQVLRRHRHPSFKVPRMRRFAIELAIWLMKSKGSNVSILRSKGLEEDLVGVAQTTSEIEVFNVFSGSVGLSRHHTTVFELVDAALSLLDSTKGQNE